MALGAAAQRTASGEVGATGLRFTAQGRYADQLDRYRERRRF